MSEQAAVGAATGEAQRIVHAIYGALDLFSSAEADLLEWSKGLRADLPAEALLPAYFTDENQGLLARHLQAAGVITGTGEIDAFALRGFQRVLELLPHFRAEEIARKPAPRPQLVLTVPEQVELPPEASHLRRSLAVRISEALLSASQRVMLASPYWSAAGNEILLDSLAKATQLGLPVTLAGARRDDVAHFDAMLALARAVAHEGVPVEALRFEPPREHSLFHAKLVAGRLGYLGSANLTRSGLGEHVEVGVPLGEVDVERAWWLLKVLKDAKLLVAEPI